MKNDINETDRKCFDQKVQYLTYIFDKLRNYDALYKLLQTSPTQAVAIQKIYVSQFQCSAKDILGHTKPLHVLSLPEFLDQSDIFHIKNKFAISLLNIL